MTPKVKVKQASSHSKTMLRAPHLNKAMRGVKAILQALTRVLPVRKDRVL